MNSLYVSFQTYSLNLQKKPEGLLKFNPPFYVYYDKSLEICRLFEFLMNVSNVNVILIKMHVNNS